MVESGVGDSIDDVIFLNDDSLLFYDLISSLDLLSEHLEEVVFLFFFTYYSGLPQFDLFELALYLSLPIVSEETADLVGSPLSVLDFLYQRTSLEHAIVKAGLKFLLVFSKLLDHVSCVLLLSLEL